MPEQDTKPDFKPWIDPDLEARIVAMVLGEASDFEREQLDRMIGERRELQIFQRYIEVAHEQLSSIGSGKFEDESGFADADWRLEAGRRDSLLEVLKQPSPEAADDVVISLASSKGKKDAARKRQRAIWSWSMGIAAGILVLCGVAIPVGHQIFGPNELSSSAERGFHRMAVAGSESADSYDYKYDDAAPTVEAAPIHIAASPMPEPQATPAPPPIPMPSQPSAAFVAPASGGAMPAPVTDLSSVTGGLAVVDPAAADVAFEGQMWNSSNGAGVGGGGIAMNGPAPSSEPAPADHFMWRTQSNPDSVGDSREVIDGFGIAGVGRQYAGKDLNENQPGSTTSMDFDDEDVHGGVALDVDFGGGAAPFDAFASDDDAISSSKENADFAQVGGEISARQQPGHGQSAPIALGAQRGFAGANESLAREGESRAQFDSGVANTRRGVAKSEAKKPATGPRSFSLELSTGLTPPTPARPLASESLAKARENPEPSKALRFRAPGEEAAKEVEQLKSRIERLDAIEEPKPMYKLAEVSEEIEEELEQRLSVAQQQSAASRQLQDLEAVLEKEEAKPEQLAQLFGNSRFDRAKADGKVFEELADNLYEIEDGLDGRYIKEKARRFESEMQSSGERDNGRDLAALTDNDAFYDPDASLLKGLNFAKEKQLEERIADYEVAYRLGTELRKAKIDQVDKWEFEDVAEVEFPEILAKQEPFSTFSLHVSDVSFKLAQAALEQGQWPEAEKIRIEEFVNAFDYGDPMPSSAEKVACRLEQAIHPFYASRNLMRVSMRTAAAGRSASTPLRLTILLDNSGSMDRADRRQTTLRAFVQLARQLQPQDQVTLIAFSRQPKILADSVPGHQAIQLTSVIASSVSDGGTNLEAALKAGFEKALDQKVDGAQNRVILITDGAANLGDAEPERLAKIVEFMRNNEIAFDAAGVGAEGYNDEILETLTRDGDGRYYFLNKPQDADDGFAKQIAGALRPAAMNVKIQVQFNPDRVGKYKLLGFEKHRLKKEDFRDDSVDAAEMAAEEAGVAVYQVEPLPEGRGNIGTVSVRFRDMSTGQMVERKWPIPYEASAYRLNEAATEVRVASVAALFAAKLKDDPVGERATYKELANIVNTLPANVKQNTRVQQLQNMIQQARQQKGDE